MIVLTPRKDIPLSLTLVTPIVAIALTLIIGAVIFALLGYDPGAALYQFFIAPISRPDQVGDLFVKACPLIIIASGLVFCYRANIWNIGAEGQMILGAMFGGWVALTFPDMSGWLMMPAMILAGMVGGLLWAMIPAILKTRFNTNEILVSLMLTYVAVLLLDWTVRGPWRDPQSFGFPFLLSLPLFLIKIDAVEELSNRFKAITLIVRHVFGHFTDIRSILGGGI